MGTPWKLVRLPADMHAELVKLAGHFDAMQSLGKMDVPSEFADPRGAHVGTPLWFVIRRALDEYHDKHRRSNRKARNGRGP
jgi:hypothetical protein